MMRLKVFLLVKTALLESVIKKTHKIRKGQLSEKNIPAYKQLALGE